MAWRASAGRAAVAGALCCALAGAAAPEGREVAPPDAVAPPPEAEPVWSTPAAWAVHALPTASAGGDAPPVARVEGPVAWATFRIPARSSLEAARAFAAGWRAAGYETVLDCGAEACGGFEFRLALEVAPSPAMRLSALDFHQITLRRDDQAASILASMAGDAAFVQVVALREAATAAADAVAGDGAAEDGAAGDAPFGNDPEGFAPAGAPSGARREAQPDEEAGGPGEDAEAPESAAPRRDAAQAADLDRGADLAAALIASGRVVLEGLAFAPGGATLAPSAGPALDRAAAALAALGDRRAAVVGHTDRSGALDVNLRVSRARAEAVRAALVARGVDGERLEAAGAGWLAPLAPGDGPEDRARNRRVELVLR